VDLGDGGHAAQAIGLEGRADDQRIAVLEDEERGQALASPEIDAGQVEEVRRRRREKAVGAENVQSLPDGLEAFPKLPWSGSWASNSLRAAGTSGESDTKDLESRSKKLIPPRIAVELSRLRPSRNALRPRFPGKGSWCATC
jgi:hypothetical protein